MTKLRVYEVAEELGVETSQLIQMLRDMDVLVRSHMSTVDAGSVARLHARLERERRGDAAKAATATRSPRRRRRRRKAPAQIDASAGSGAPPETEEAGAEVEEPADEEFEPIAADTDIGAAEVEQATTVESLEEETLPEVGTIPEEETVGAAVEEDVGEPEMVVEEAAAGEEEEEEEAVEEEDSAEVEEVEVEEGPPSKRKKRRPKPVRRDMPSASEPTASAAPGGTVRISAEGYTVDGRRKAPRGERRKRRRVDRDAVQENVKKTLAQLGGPGPRKRRRDTPTRDREEEREKVEQEREEERKTVRVNEFLTVAELADLVGVSAQEIITSAFKNLGLMVTINQRLDFDQIELVCEEAGFNAIREEAFEADLAEEPDEAEDEGRLKPRPPVVTVMGHVDHGKTSLLDHIRSANVIAGEAGGITQHIGAYHVDLHGGKTITFLDTPGHEAFTAMRARGADLTDIVILVVAADDSVMPQTIEAISHAKNAGVPIVVAVNKIDLPTADVQRVKSELAGHDVVLEDFGGEVLSADVSAKTGEGIDDLLEKVLLQAELLEVKANPDREARGTVVEAQLDRGMGPVATVLVQSGTLEVGDDFVVGLYGGRVRALLDERGNAVDTAGPGIPVRVLGLEGVPQAGDTLIVLEPDRVREIVTRRQQLEREKDMRRRAGGGSRLEDVFEAVQAGEQVRLNVVMKGDMDGSVQALSDSVERLSTDEVAVEVIHRGVGGINESDVLLASTSDALIVGFHVRPDAGATATAEREGVEIRIYNVIYEAVEEIRLALEGLLAPEEREVTVGSAEVRELFRVPKVGTVAGCFVTSGTMRRNLPVRLLRDHMQIYQGRIASLKRFKDDVREVREGYECGISIEGYNDIKTGDVIECFEIEEVARKLAKEPAG